MKPHLPLSLLRSLFDTFKGVTRTTLGLGTLLLLPGATTILWHYAYDESDEGSGIRTLDTSGNSCGTYIGTAAEELEAHELENEALWELRHERARALANIAAENVDGFRHSSGGGSITVPHRLKPAGKGGKNTHLLDTLLISAGVEPLQNYVAHGGGPGSSSSSSSSSSGNSSSAEATAPIAPAAPPARAGRMLMRSMALFSLNEATSTGQSADTTTTTTTTTTEAGTVTTEEGLIWVGDRNAGTWDNATFNWTEDGTRTAISTNGSDSATFHAGGVNKNINVASGQNLTDMTVSAGGYAFSGGGNITLSGTLLVDIPSATHTSGSNAAHTLSFGSANHVHAGNIVLRSGLDTITTFSGMVEVDNDLTITNCLEHEKGGSYNFNNSVTVHGDFSATLGTTGKGGASDKNLLNVTGAVNAGSLRLDGTSLKTFNNTVTTHKNTLADGSTTSGDLTISGYEKTASSALDGITTFNKDVSVAGKLSVINNSEAIFKAALSSTATGGLQIYLNQGMLRYEGITLSLAEGAYSLGTITLGGYGALSVGERAEVSARLDAKGNDFSVEGTSQRADLTLAGSSTGKLTISGGHVNLQGSGAETIGGQLTVDNNATLTLKSNNLFAENGITLSSGGTLNLGTTTQELKGGITLTQGGHLTGGTGINLSGASTPSITFSGKDNEISSALTVGSGHVTITAAAAEGDTRKDHTLTLSGDIAGGSATAGSLTFTGAGTTVIAGDLSYAGNVFVGDASGSIAPGKGAQLELGADNALAQANKVTVYSGSTLSTTHGGSSVNLHGAGGVRLEHGAALSFTNLTGHEDTPALALDGELIFGGDVVFNFVESDANRKIENLTTYELITSKVGINSSSTGTVTVYANNRVDDAGNPLALDSSQYAFGFYIDDSADQLRHFTFTLLAGKSWCGGASGEWHTQSSPGTYTNWTEGPVGDIALFRTQEGIDAVTITMKESTGAKGLYMDGSTHYTIEGADDLAQAFKADEAVRLIKKGSGTMTWKNVDLNAGRVELEEGTLALTGGSTMSASDRITIADITYAVPENGGLATKNNSATLSIDKESFLKYGENATLSAYASGTNATLHGVEIEGNRITAYESGLSGTAEVPCSHSISNAAIDGFSLAGKDATHRLNLQGTGSLANTTLGENVTISGTYSMGENITLEATVTNTGKLIFDKEDTVLGIGGLAGALGETTTYTLFEGGGQYEVTGYSNGWAALNNNNFRVNGIKFSDVIQQTGSYTLTVTPTITADGKAQITLNTTGLAFINWDSEWDTSNEGYAQPILAVNFHAATADVTGGDFTYNNRVKDAPENVYVLNLSSASGNSEQAKVLGFGTGVSTNANEHAHIWVNSEASQFDAYVGGTSDNAYYFTWSGGTTLVPSAYYYGNTHLQMLGEHANAYTIVGGSTHSRQIGDSYLTFAAGDYTGEIDYTVYGPGASDGKGAYNPIIIVAGNYGNMGYNIYYDYLRHEGDSFLHISAGKFGAVYAGSHETYTMGDTSALVDGGSIALLQGGDFTYEKRDGAANIAGNSGETTHTGNVSIDLKGGTLSEVYAAGGRGFNESEYTFSDNKNTLKGNAVISLYAENGNMASSFRENSISYLNYDYEQEEITTTPLLYGGKPSIEGGTATLVFANAGSYHLESYLDGNGDMVTDASGKVQSVDIQYFDHFNVAKGAHAIIAADKFNTTNALTISGIKGETGAGMVEIVGSNATVHDVTLQTGVTLYLHTHNYSTAAELSNIVVESGAGIHLSPGEDGSDVSSGRNNVRLTLIGDGADGLGALYKLNGVEVAEVAFPDVTLTGDASVGAASGAVLSMVMRENTTDNETQNEVTTYLDNQLDLTNGGASGERGYVLTKQGSGDFALYNTNVTGGTINVTEGHLTTAYSSSAGETDLVLHAGTGLVLADNAMGFLPGTDTPADFNGIAFESLSGAGDINLGQNGWLYINMGNSSTNRAAYTDFAQGFDPGYEYAHYSGNISSAGNGRVTKAGPGTEYFTGSASTYHGETTIEGGRLYLLGTSMDEEGDGAFAAAAEGTDGVLTATTQVAQGVIGTGTLVWKGGDVYLGDGVRIYNEGKTENGTMSIGVEAVTRTDEDGREYTYYNEATYSGVLTSNAGMTKEGAGTLNVDQRGSFAGGTYVNGGTLNLYGWASANDAVIYQKSGSTFMLSYDGTYTGEEASTTISEATNFRIAGTGDERWKTAERTGNTGDTAAFISDIGSAKTLTIKGTISDGTADGTGIGTTTSGNVLHSGEGTLILSGANSYTGGTTVTNGMVIAESDTAFGATEDGMSAMLATREQTTLKVNHEVHDISAYNMHEEGITLAASSRAADGTSTGYAGNDIRGTVCIGTSDEKTAGLNMEGSGYYADRTELGRNDILVFNGKASSNWDGQYNAEGNAPKNAASMGGANTLAGSTGAVVVVSDTETVYGTDSEGMKVYFQVTDGITETSEAEAQAAGDSERVARGAYNGDLVVQGDMALLHIQGGQLAGGSFSVSGNGARLDAKRSAITVDKGEKISLSSKGDVYRDAASAAVLAAYSVQVEEGGHLLACKEATHYQFENGDVVEDSQVDVKYALGSYKTAEDNYNYHFSTGEVETQYDKYFASNKIDNQNRQTAAVLETVGGLTMNAGSIYELYDTNVSLAGTQLTFNVTEDTKIALRGDQISAYIQSLLAADAEEARFAEGDLTAREIVPTEQLVLFSDVGSFNAILDGENLTPNAQALEYREMTNQIYVMLARDFLRTDGVPVQASSGTRSGDATTLIDPLADATNILLVYDAGARVVYLDRNPNTYEPLEEEDYHPVVLPIPEPTTATLSLLALTALAARRRRRA